MKACQDVSHAGRRLGMKPGTRSGLWSHMAYAIDKLRPRLVVAENVRGLLSAEAGGDVESCAWCVGDGSGSPLRALGAVLGDLADLGYDAQWHGVRASDVGAPHGRFRIFVIAWPADADGPRLEGCGPSGRSAQEPSPVGALLPTPRTTDMNGAGSHGEGGLDLRTAIGLLPTPRATDGTNGGPNQRGSSGDLMLPSAVTLLPRPAVNDMGAGKTVEAWDEWTAKMQAAHGNGNGHGKSLAIEAQRLLPTPTATDAVGSRNATAYRDPDAGPHNSGTTLTDFAWQYEGHVDQRLLPTPEASRAGGTAEQHLAADDSQRTAVTNLDVLAASDNPWGAYAAAIARWEYLTRPAPAPTQPSTKGTPQLSPAFSEWMMGLPAGHVTGVPGLSRNEQLKALGNGVVPQQAAHAVRLWLSTFVAVAA